MRQPTIAIVGAGPAGLMAAEVAAAAGAEVTVYERMASPGRKLLLAGRGGLNLTHSEGTAAFRARYGAAAAPLVAALDGLDPEALRRWCAELGIETFIGTSGRIFPVSYKTSPLLRAWLRRLDAAGVRLATRHRWLGWRGESGLRFATAWPESFHARYAGQPLQNVALSFAGTRARGDVVVTRDGLEGGALYALSAPLRDAIARDGDVVLHVALRPDLSTETLVAKLGKRRPKQSFSTAMRKALALSPVAIALIREGAPDSRATMAPHALATLVNAIPVRLTAPLPIARAISTAGGVRFDALDANLMLRARPGTFVAGEMLDWEAPTGGYLMQACFATGRAAALGAITWLERRRGVA